MLKNEQHDLSQIDGEIQELMLSVKTLKSNEMYYQQAPNKSYYVTVDLLHI